MAPMCGDAISCYGAAMGEKENDLGWRPIMIFAAIALGAFVLHRAWPNSADYCPSSEDLTACHREWVNALAGWAAALAAAITIIFLIRQNTEQKKQTDFLLGDGMPTIDALRHMKRSNEVVVRIVNWNRRPIIVRGVKIVPAIFDTALIATRIQDRESPDEGLSIRHLDDDNLFDVPIAMHGWKNRSVAPCELRIDVGGRLFSGFEWITDWAGTSIEVEITIAGEEESRITLKCPIAVAQ